MDEREKQKRMREGTLPVYTTENPPFFKDKPYGESLTSQFRNKSLLLPCGCSIDNVPTWIEAMNHLLFPGHICPSQPLRKK